MGYERTFETAVGQRPYPYQVALAAAAIPPDALVAPTGAGKTAAVVLAWLYRRRFAGAAVRRATARRLVLCLPMRVLVSQSADAVRRWLANLGLLDESTDPLERTDGVSVHVLLGGAASDEWHLHPEREAVLVGTQDMLLSRALNRGYGSSRFLWPWHFGLVANDCWWVFDEVQLMGVGLATGLQLTAFRRGLGCYGPTHSLFMSATLDRDWLSTVDHTAPDPGRVLALSPDDLRTPALAARRRAPKVLSRAETTIGRGFERRLADEVLRRHVAGFRTIVVLNTVERAVLLYEALGHRLRGRTAIELLHSRFRAPDREKALQRLLADDFQGIVISTQVIEAGLDVSARTLFTELAPWPSLVQRAGRCNRAGELPSADVIWIDDAEGTTSLPYHREDLQRARKTLESMTAFNPEAIETANVQVPAPDPLHTLRRRDVIDLFDTTPDLAGMDIDVSRFIRDGDDRDAQVFWRNVATAPNRGEKRARREELCSVPVADLVKLVTEGRSAWCWDHVEAEWRRVGAERVMPGAIYLLLARDGGYRADVGWDRESGTPVAPIATEADVAEEALLDDFDSFLDDWVPLTVHSVDTRDAARQIVGGLELEDLPVDTVVRAAQAHDLGKAHPVFQATMKRELPADLPADELWAKSGHRHGHERRGLRHELASALAWLQHASGPDHELVAYLLAAHHGKVRLSIRAISGDDAPAGQERLHARGIWEGDTLPSIDLGDGLALPSIVLDLSPMLLGRRNGVSSWAERVLGLRERYGPFRLAFLEALVRAADVRATRRERRGTHGKGRTTEGTSR